MNIINLLPKYFRRKLINPKDLKWRIDFKKQILEYYKDEANIEICNILRFIKKNKLTAFNYDFIYKYENRDSPIYQDKKLGLYYVIDHNKKLYFKRSLNTKSKVKYYYNAICKEQDKESPHRYLNDNHNVRQHDCVVDCGVAEGNFALEVIERVKKIYLVECDPEWIEALTHTFKPYQQKVIIIQKKLSNRNTKEEITLSNIIKLEKGKIDFVKMDIEGAELSALADSKEELKNLHGSRLSICTYHRQNDEQDIINLLKDFTSIQHTPGYILNYFDKQLKSPYFRRGVLNIRVN